MSGCCWWMGLSKGEETFFSFKYSSVLFFIIVVVRFSFTKTLSIFKIQMDKVDIVVKIVVL